MADSPAPNPGWFTGTPPEQEPPPDPAWYTEEITNHCCRCCFSREAVYRFFTLDAWNPLTGTKWNVEKLRGQVITDIWFSAVIFIISEIMIAVEAAYWRPVKWSIYWIVLCLIVSSIGHFGASKRCSGAIICFIVLMLMFSAINLAHVNQMRGEMVRSCKTAQISFKHCDPTYDSQANTYLSQCIYLDQCTHDQIKETSCEAPGSKHCDDVSSMEASFWLNAFINFMTYAEPLWFAFMCLIRMEVTGDVAPAPQLEEDEYPNPGMSTVFKCQDQPAPVDEGSTPLLGANTKEDMA